MGNCYYKTPLWKPPRKVHKQKVLTEFRYIQLALSMHGVLKTMLNTECIPIQWVPLVWMRKQQFSVSTLAQHIYLVSSFSPCLGPCSYSSVPSFPPSLCSQDLHYAVYAAHSSGFLLTWNKERSATSLYLWWSQGRGRTLFVDRNYYVIQRVNIISFIYFIYKMTSISSNFRYLHLK